MAENRALSQWEIDALLNQIPGAAGAAEGAPVGITPTPPDRAFARVIKTYDFRRPDKFSKEQWATLQSMHEHFARLHPDWCVGTPEWEERLAREYDSEFINVLGITPEEYDRRFLKLMGIEPPVVSESNP